MAAPVASGTMEMMLKTESLLSRFQGALIGAVVGDCLGAHFETRWHLKVEEVTNFFSGLADMKYAVSDSSDSESASVSGPGDVTRTPEKRREHSFTDDTAMMRSVAASLISHQRLDTKDMANRFMTEYMREPYRGYGTGVGKVFKKLRDEGCAHPHGPASRQFGGTGSYGNGGAMRIAPAALFGYNMDQKDLNRFVDNITKITHTHDDAKNGAKLQTAAVKLALQTNRGQLETESFVEHLHKLMNQLESEDLQVRRSGPPLPKRRAKRKTEEVDQPYCHKLRLIQKYLKEEIYVSRSDIEDTLGNDVSALGSVPAAVYCFLRCLKPVRDIKVDNPFERTIIYAVTLGGDTDTIAAMAGAMAGAYHGVERIPRLWQEICEGVDAARSHANKLHQLTFKSENDDQTEQQERSNTEVVPPAGRVCEMAGGDENSGHQVGAPSGGEDGECSGQSEVKDCQDTARNDDKHGHQGAAPSKLE